MANQIEFFGTKCICRHSHFSVSFISVNSNVTAIYYMHFIFSSSLKEEQTFLKKIKVSLLQ